MINKNNDIELFFENILGQIYISDPSKNKKTIRSTNIEKIFLNEAYPDKSYLLGKTKEVYFLIVLQVPDEKYKYSLVTMHQDPIILLSHFNKRTPFLENVSVEEFWNKLQLKLSLEHNLDNNVISKNNAPSRKI